MSRTAWATTAPPARRSGPRPAAPSTPSPAPSAPAARWPGVGMFLKERKPGGADRDRRPDGSGALPLLQARRAQGRRLLDQRRHRPGPDHGQSRRRPGRRRLSDHRCRSPALRVRPRPRRGSGARRLLGDQHRGCGARSPAISGRAMSSSPSCATTARATRASCSTPPSCARRACRSRPGSPDRAPPEREPDVRRPGQHRLAAQASPITRRPGGRRDLVPAGRRAKRACGIRCRASAGRRVLRPRRDLRAQGPPSAHRPLGRQVQLAGPQARPRRRQPDRRLRRQPLLRLGPGVVDVPLHGPRGRHGPRWRAGEVACRGPAR